MRPVTVTVGPLAAAVANGISASQRAPAAQAFALDGSTTAGYSASNIAASQAVAGAGNLTLNAPAVILSPPASVVVVSAGNDTGVTYTVSGVAADGLTALSEVLTGANASRVATSTIFYKVTQIRASGAAAGNVSAGSNGVATLDTARQILITSAGNDTSIAFAIMGTDSSGNAISESVQGTASTATSALSYKTVTQVKPSGATASTVTIGTNGVANSQFVRFDDYSSGTAFVQTKVTGTVNYTVDFSQDDTNSPTSPVAPSGMVWDASASPFNAAAAGGSGQIAVAPAFARLTVNSGAGSVTATFTQAGSPP